MYALVKLLPNLLLVVLWSYALRIDAEACSIREELDKLMALQQPLSESYNNSSEKEKDATVEVCLIFLHRQMHIHIQINRFCTVQDFHLRKAPPFRVRILVLICLSIFLCQCNNHLMFGPFGAPIYHIKRHSIHIRLRYFIILSLYLWTKHFCYSFYLHCGPCFNQFSQALSQLNFQGWKKSEWSLWLKFISAVPKYLYGSGS